jgi:hypothetical protein
MICFKNIKTVKGVGGVKIKGLNDDDRFDEPEQGNCTSLKLQSGSAALSWRTLRQILPLLSGFGMHFTGKKDGRDMWRGYAKRWLVQSRVFVAHLIFEKQEIGEAQSMEFIECTS